MRGLKTYLVLSLLCSAVAYTQDDLESYLSSNKKVQFSYDYEKNKADSSKLRDSWISPIRMQYVYNKSKPYDVVQVTKNSSITIDQPIFSSGGIYYGIKYAQASLAYANYSVEVAKRKLIKDTISTLMQIKKIDLNIQKQELLIKNAEINLALKKDAYLGGQLDSSFLDRAIIDKNSFIEMLYDIETSKKRLISQFKTLSDIDYKTAFIPHFELLAKGRFLEKNLVLKMAKSKIKKDDYNQNITIAKYLPRVNFTAGYNWSKSENQQFGGDNGISFSQNINYYNYGFRVSIPLDINTFRDIQSSKVNYLKSKVDIKEKQKTLESLYEQVSQNIVNLDKKKMLSIENKKLYKKLLDDTKELYEAGYKTKYDIEILNNSLKIQDINVKVLDMDKQLDLLNLYELYKESE